MKYEELKEEIKAIAEVANSVPEIFKERCFELLLQHLLVPAGASNKPPATASATEKGPALEEPLQKPASTISDGNLPTPSQIKIFMQKTGATAADLSKIVLYEDDKVHFIQEPDGNTISRGQIEWALLLALKRGIEKNVLDVDPEEVRSICQDKGFYDAKNYAANFKSPAAAKFFQGEMKPQGAAQKLSNEGITELGKIVKEFASRPTQ